MTRTIKRVGIKTQLFKPKPKQKLIFELIKNNEANGYYRKGNFSTEIIWDGKSYMFPSKGKYRSYTKGLFLFGMVRKDAKNFLKSGRKLRVPKKFPTNEYNDKFTDFDAKITGTDLNHAYWRIAYNLGIISNRTYISGLDDEFKTVRLSALSTLGKGKDYHVIKNGVFTNEVVKIGFNEDMDKLYRAIRQTCFKYMNQIMKILGNEFVAYKTDCVYYVDSKENRKIVRDFFNEKEMNYKQLPSIKKGSTRVEPLNENQ